MIGMPINASAHGYEIDHLIFLIHLLMLVLFVGWGIYFIFTLFRFNNKMNPKADYRGVQSHATSVIEIAVIVVEAVLLIGFSIPFWAKQVNAFPERTDVLEVRVVAEQFAWNVHYPGKDGVFGKTNPKLIDNQSNPIGIDSSDPHAADDVTNINQLHVPIGRPIVIHLTSKDVIHSFALNAMRVKQDTIPGMSIKTWFTPVKTGQYDISCAQLCGIGHYRMKGFLTVESPEEFQTWIDAQSTVGGSAGSSEDSFWN